MSDNHAAVHDSLRRRLAAVNCVVPIVDCIRKMRVEGLADNLIAGLFRHAADELDQVTMTKGEKVDSAASSRLSSFAAERQCSGPHRCVSKKSTTLALSADEARPPYGFILLPFTTASGFAMKRSSVALSQTKSALCMALE